MTFCQISKKESEKPGPIGPMPHGLLCISILQYMVNPCGIGAIVPMLPPPPAGAGRVQKTGRLSNFPEGTGRLFRLLLSPATVRALASYWPASTPSCTLIGPRHCVPHVD